MSRLIGYWDINEGTGTDVLDKTGYDNDGVFEGGMSASSWVQSVNIVGSSLNFNGATFDRVDFGPGSGTPLISLGTGDFSISFWMKSTDSTPLSNGAVVSKYQGVNDSIIIQSNGTTNQLRLYLEKSGTSYTYDFNAAPFDAEWHHIVIILDRTLDKAYCYIDNVKDAIEGDLSSVPTDISNTGNLAIGALNNGANPYEGRVDFLRVYDDALTTDEIDKLFIYPDDKPIYRKEQLETDLSLLNRLDKGEELKVYDTSGYDIQGVVLNGDASTIWIDGVSNKAIKLDGTNDYIQNTLTVGDPALDIGNGSFSVSYWFKSNDTTGNSLGMHFSKYTNDQNRIEWYYRGAGVDRFEIAISKSGVTSLFFVDTDYYDQLWHHVIVIYDSDHDFVQMYVDKDLVIDSSASTLAADISNGATIITYGQRNGTSAFPADIAVDEFRIYNRKLSYTEIKHLYTYPDGTPSTPEIESGAKLEIHLKSPTNDLIGILADNNLSGSILNAEVSQLKNGGVNEFLFNVPRTIDQPLTTDTECYLYIDNVLSLAGFIKEEPRKDQDNPVLDIKAIGFYQRLKRITVNEAYSSKSLNYIVCDLLETYLPSGNEVGLNFNPYKINVATLSSLSIDFDDRSLLDAIIRIVEICNNDYENTKYRFYVDNEKDVVIEAMDTDPITTLFEGYQYQEPEVALNISKMINSVLAYRAKSAAGQEIEYVNTYQNTESIGRFGLFEEKITFPDYLDSTTISYIVDFLLDRRSEPQPTIKINNYEITEVLTFGDYILQNRRELYWRVIADCDTLTGWNTGGLTNATLTTSIDKILTGKRSLKLTIPTTALNEYIEFTPDELLALPQVARVYMYTMDDVPTLEFRYYDDQGNEFFFELGGSNQILNQWTRYEESMGQETEVSNLEVDPNGSTEDLEVNIDASTVEDLEVRDVVTPGLLSIEKIRITIKSSIACVVYIDRLDVFCDILNFNKLQLEEVKYNLSSVGLFAELDFGEKSPNIIDEINGKVDENNIALQIFSKQ